MFFRCFPRLFPGVLSKGMLDLVRSHMPMRATPLNRIASQMPDEVMEELPNGLKAFLMEYPDHFAVFPRNGVLHGILLPPLPASSMRKRTLPVPQFVVSVADCAEVWKTNEEEAKAKIESLTPYANLLPLQRNGYPTELFTLPNIGRSEEFTCNEADNTFASYKVQLYDVCRLARCLTTYSFTPWAELHEKAQPLLSRPLTQVVMSAPERFLLNSEGVRYQLGPEVDLETPKLTSEAVLEERLEYARKQSKREKKRQLQRQLFLKKNPAGSPLLDKDVLAHLLYDMLPAEGAAILSRLKECVTETYGDVFPARLGAMLLSFPHLFVLQDKGNMELCIYRADTAPVLSSADDMSDEVIAQSILASGPKARARDHSLSTRSWSIVLPRNVRMTIIQRHGSYRDFIKAMPQYFEHHSDVEGDSETDHCRFFYTKELRDALHEEHLARLQRQAEAIYAEERRKP